MNTKYYLTVLYLLCIIFIGVSCSKDAEKEVLSCDPNVDAWAQSKFKSLQDISYQSIIVLPDEQQRAAFRAATPEARLRLWQEKLEHVLAMKWTIDERHHLELLHTFITKEHFSEPTTLELIEIHKTRNDFLKTWLYYSKANLEWSAGTIKAIVTRIDMKGFTGQLTDDIGGGSGTCTCSTSDDYCGPAPLGYCKQFKNNCKIRSWGCGTMFLWTCDGQCELGIPESTGS